jgi:hypothetical protein
MHELGVSEYVETVGSGACLAHFTETLISKMYFFPAPGFGLASASLGTGTQGSTLGGGLFGSQPAATGKFINVKMTLVIHVGLMLGLNRHSWKMDACIHRLFMSHDMFGI